MGVFASRPDFSLDLDQNSHYLSGSKPSPETVNAHARLYSRISPSEQIQKAIFELKGQSFVQFVYTGISLAVSYKFPFHSSFPLREDENPRIAGIFEEISNLFKNFDKLQQDPSSSDYNISDKLNSVVKKLEEANVPSAVVEGIEIQGNLFKLLEILNKNESFKEETELPYSKSPIRQSVCEFIENLKNYVLDLEHRFRYLENLCCNESEKKEKSEQDTKEQVEKQEEEVSAVEPVSPSTEEEEMSAVEPVEP